MVRNCVITSILDLMTSKYFILVYLLISFCFSAIAQVGDEEIILSPLDTIEGNSNDDTWKTAIISDDMTVDEEQNKQWRMGEYGYSAKPKNAWEAGLSLGHFFIDGDIDRTLPGGWGAGVHLRKAIHYVFSIRGTVFFGQATGLDPQAWKHKSFTNSKGVGGGLVEAEYAPYSQANNPIIDGQEPIHWFPSHRTRYMYCSLEGIVNIGNLLFHKERNKWNWYALGGVGLDNNWTQLDLLDANGNPYTDLKGRVNWTEEKFNTQAGRLEIKNDLRNIYDGVYETEAPKKKGIYRVGDDINIHVVWIAAMGISRKITKRFNVGLEHQVMVTDNDHLDGIKFRTSLDQTNNVDIGHYTNARLGINIGNFDKRTEPLYWLNPLDNALNDIASLKQRPALDLTDADEDGVIDMMDQELDTDPGCPVDTRGVTLDSDGDGIVDCKDKEPYSPPCPTDEFGVANCPKDCCIEEDDVRRIINETTPAIIKSTPVSSRPGGNNTTTTVVRSGCGEWFLPMIHYDLNKHNIKSEYYSHLHHVAYVMKKCPELCIAVQGHTDQRSNNDYNTKLSYKRAQGAIDYLVANYGVDRSRLKLMYGGEENPLVSSPNSESHHYMNRRVEFRVCEGSDFDMQAPVGTSTQSSQTKSGEIIRDYNNGYKNSGY